MAYQELIDNFEVMREPLRQYFAFGMLSSGEYGEQNSQSRAQELVQQRLNSWMGTYLDYYTSDHRRIYYFKVDGRSVLQNPLYRTYQSKTVSKRKPSLFFYSLAVMSTTEYLSAHEIADRIVNLYIRATEELDDEQSDARCEEFADKIKDDTLSNMLKEYAALGIFEQKGSRYRLRSTGFPLTPLHDGVFFASEQTPLGVIGFYIMNRIGAVPEGILFKHHYFLNALDQGIVCLLLQAMEEKKQVSILDDHNPDQDKPLRVWPLKIYCSTQSGRQHLLCYDPAQRSPRFVRIDRIRSIELLEEGPACPMSEEALQDFETSVWGIGFQPHKSKQKAHVEMILRIDRKELPIIKGRLDREKRHGTVDKVSDTEWRFSADIYAPREIVPWVRSFIGRIISFRCSDKNIEQHFYDGLRKLTDLYFADLEPEGISKQVIPPDSFRPDRQDYPLFHEIYGRYYVSIGKILRHLGSHPYEDETALQSLLNDPFRDEGTCVVQDMLGGWDLLHYNPMKAEYDRKTGKVKFKNRQHKEGEWNLLIYDQKKKGFFTPIGKLPEIPLTTLEERWLKAVVSDPRVSLFLPEEGIPALENVRPLYSTDRLVFFDRYAKGDPFTDEKYRKVFRTILYAIREHRKLVIVFDPANSDKERDEPRIETVCPYRVEYSAKEDKYRLITCKPGPVMRILVSSIRYCSDAGSCKPIGDSPVPLQKERTMELHLFDEGNALERLLLHFSDLKKRTRRLDKGERRYSIELTYRADDEKEMIMRILAFGPAVKVLSPASVTKDIQKRLQKQQALLTAPLPSD